jgi:hypothetical protein
VGPNGEVNWIDFLPEEVKNLVADPSYIPGYLQGTQARACKIKAFIVKTEEDTRTGIAEGSWEIGNLFNDGRATQCVTGISRSDDPIVDNIVGPGWDVVIYSPTRGKGVCPDCDNNLLVPEIGEYPDDLGNGIPGGLESNLATPFCGSSGVRTRSKSIFGVGFTVVPVDNQMPGVAVTHQLITDLGTANVELAQPLLSVDEYAILQDRYFNQVLDKWENAKSKLVNQPNAADTNLGALTAQLRNLRNENEFPPEDGFQGYADNPDNIQGDIETRIDVLLFWIDERLRQLIPLDGYDTTAP